MKGVQDYARDLTSPEVKVRRHAAFQLRYFGRPALAPLETALRDSDPLVALGAMDSLRWLRDEGCVPKLIAILNQKHDLLSPEAAGILGDLGFREAFPALRAAARDPAFPGREEVLLALGAFPEQGLEKELLSFLAEAENPDEEVACAEALAELQCYRAMPQIIELYYRLDDDFYRDDLTRCLASLLGKPEFFQEGEIDLADATEFFSSLVNEEIAEAPPELKKIYKSALQALQKKSFRRFYESLAEALLLTSYAVLEAAGILEESDFHDEDRILQKLIDTRLGAIITTFSFLSQKKLITREKYTGRDLELAVFCTSATWEELNRIFEKRNPGAAAGKADDLAALITQMIITSTVKPRFLLKKIIGYGDPAVNPLKSVLKKYPGSQAGFWAAEALGEINTPGAVEALLEVIPDVDPEDEDGELMLHTIQDALAFCGEKVIEPALKKIQAWTNTGSWQNIISVGGALAKIRHPRSLSFLLGQLEDANPEIRRAALEHLQEYGDPAAIFQIRRLLADEDEEVVEAAQVALVELGENNGISFPEMAELKKEVERIRTSKFDQELYKLHTRFPDLFDADPDDEPEWLPDEDEEGWEESAPLFDEEEDDDEEWADHPPLKPIVKPPKIGRNDPCPCGSGKKYKKCCGKPVGSG
ncbi:MAG: HEAT repeat domain-containing protein [Armatimonadetes bacterium]|nr:HEAT repeat domain-containing protein [Armatimonadota bacterium]